MQRSFGILHGRNGCQSVELLDLLGELLVLGELGETGSSTDGVSDEVQAVHVADVQGQVDHGGQVVCCHLVPAELPIIALAGPSFFALAFEITAEVAQPYVESGIGKDVGGGLVWKVGDPIG